jgi:hypothetical protein
MRMHIASGNRSDTVRSAESSQLELGFIRSRILKFQDQVGEMSP